MREDVQDNGNPQRTMVSIDVRSLTMDLVHYLKVVKGAAAGQLVQIGEDRITIGRDPARGVTLPDTEVSRAHCEVWLEDQAVRVRDLGSTNGTYVDGQLLGDSIALPVSGRLRLGRHVLRHELLSRCEVERHVQLADDLERARRYLAALIPPPLATGPLRTHAHHAASAALGGDAHGHIRLDDNRFALYVVDVAGHGVGSAMHSAAVVSSLRNGTLPSTDFGDPQAVLAGLNRAFPMGEHNGLFCTIWYGVLDLQSGRLDYGSAGHPPVLLRRPDGAIHARLATENPPIGTFDGHRHDVATAALQPGDLLYLYTDGAYEIAGPDGSMQTEDDFERRVCEGDPARPETEPRRLFDAACALHGGPVPDDFTVVVARYLSS